MLSLCYLQVDIYNTAPMTITVIFKIYIKYNEDEIAHEGKWKSAYKCEPANNDIVSEF